MNCLASNHNFSSVHRMILRLSFFILAILICLLPGCNSNGNKVKAGESSDATISPKENISSEVEEMDPNALEKVQFKILINASPEKVYEMMTDVQGYRK